MSHFSRSNIPIPPTSCMVHARLLYRKDLFQVNFIDYMDEIAEEISCKPDLMKCFLKDPILALKVGSILAV